MLRPKYSAQVYLYSDFVDMRKSIDGLAALRQVDGSAVHPLAALEIVSYACPQASLWIDRAAIRAGHHEAQEGDRSVGTVAHRV